MNNFKKVKPEELEFNAFSQIGKKWMLITAGDKDNFNTMTASWGSIGVLWNKNVVSCFIRPERYTYSFVENQEYFTLSFLPETEREALNICGKLSGRDTDKVLKAGLKPIFDFGVDAVSFEQAQLVIVAKKIYFSDLQSDNFLDASIANNYKTNGLHRMFIGEIVDCYQKTN